MKFVDEADVNNKYQAPKDDELMAKIRTDDIRNAFIRMLLDRWVNRVSAFKLIPVPKEIKDVTDFNDNNYNGAMFRDIDKEFVDEWFKYHLDNTQ